MYGHCDASQGLLLGAMVDYATHSLIHPPVSNRFMNNIVVIGKSVSNPSVIATTNQHFAKLSANMSISSNLYFQEGRSLATAANLFPLGSYAEWRMSGWDKGSIIDADPDFLNASGGDFSIRPGSPALRVFKPLPMPTC